MPDTTFTAAQIAIAARELLDAAGSEATPTSETLADAGPYTAAQAVHLLREEIRLLRERGFTDEQIADLLGGFDIEVSAEELSRNSPRLD
jgi:hypothetical protein